MKFLKHLPNIFTSLNLLSGSVGIVAVFNDDIFTAATFIIIGAVFDYLDGFFAKLLNAQSALGVQLDSLADLISFGLLPSLIYFHMISKITGEFYPYISLIVVVASAFRLAKFNIDENQKNYFLGLPTPASAFLTAGLVFVYYKNWDSFEFIFSNPNMLAVIIIIQSFFLNANLRFFSLKFKNFSWSENKFQYILIFISLALIVSLFLTGIFFILLSYIILSVIFHFTIRNDVSKTT